MNKWTLVLWGGLVATALLEAVPSRLVAFGDDAVVIRPISTAPHRQQFPQISGDLIVWEDNRHDPVTRTPGIYDIFLYDLRTNTERQLTTNSTWNHAPDIDGDRVVWQSGCDVYLDDVRTNTVQQLTHLATKSGCPSYAEYPKISGNSVVYVVTSSGNDLVAFDLTTNTERRIVKGTVVPYFPAIDGDRIVWADERNGDRDIYLYDLKTNQERPIATGPAIQDTPAISGDKVVWLESHNIFLYDLATGTQRQITSRPNAKWNPHIWGNRIVWYEDSRDGDPKVYNGENYDIYLYDLSTSTERRITANPWAEVGPAIWQNRIVWQDYRNSPNETDLYLAELPGPTLGVSATQLQLGKSITVSWTAPPNHFGFAFRYDRIVMYVAGTDAVMDVRYTGGLVAGSTTFTPQNFGTYEFRYLLSGNSNPVAVSPVVAVGVKLPPPPGPGPAPTLSFVATATVLSPGGQFSTLRWTTSVGSSCTASGGWAGSKLADGSEHREIVRPGTTTSYTLSCTANGATVKKTIVVIVLSSSPF